MIPLRINEKDHPDFDEPIVELWRENEFVGYVFWDEDVPVVQVFPDGDGDPFDLDVHDLARILDVAQQIVTPDVFAEDPELSTLSRRIAESGEVEGGWSDEDYRIVELSQEFDDRAVHRDADGEGFFARAEAEALIAKCEHLGVAVVEMEALDWDGRSLTPRPDLHLMVRAEPGAEWPAFRPQANATVAARLDDWPRRDSLVVSFVVQLPDGETRVL
ncbi:MAG: hypothetical protein ACE5GC_09400 [Acidimicrobiia bacterium]